jgi:hypothetical protein
MRKVWWRCPDGHTWQTPVAKRAQVSRGETGYCPECANRQAAQRLRARWATRTVDDPLPLTHPAVAAQLDPPASPWSASPPGRSGNCGGAARPATTGKPPSTAAPRDPAAPSAPASNPAPSL